MGDTVEARYLLLSNELINHLFKKVLPVEKVLGNDYLGR